MKLYFRLSNSLLVLALVVGSLTAGDLPFDRGATGLAFALRKLPVHAGFLHTAAHPDDEDNPLLVMLGRGRGYRTGLLTLTRGDGGQNEIGPELFQALGIIRTEELMSMHKYDGARQMFTRAYEFGYSFSPEETFEKWGREEILRDVVRAIRLFRPQVIVSLPRSGQGGGQHHQASAVLTEEAFHAAADPNRFPEQIREGLRPWRAAKLFERYRGIGGASFSGDTPPGVVRMNSGGYEPLVGRTYAQIGWQGRSMHKCQGMVQIIPQANAHSSLWKRIDDGLESGASEDDLFSGIDTSLFAIASLAGAEIESVPFLYPALHDLQSLIEQATEAFEMERPGNSAPAVGKGLQIVRTLRKKIADSPLSEGAKYELDFALRNKQRDFEEAFRLAAQVSIDVIASDGVVVPGQEFEVTMTVLNGGLEPLTLKDWRISVPEGWQVTPSGEQPLMLVPAGSAAKHGFNVVVSTEASATEPFWSREDESVDRYQVVESLVNEPWAPPDVTASIVFVAAGVESVVDAPAEFPYQGPWVGGEQRQDVLVVPAVSLSMDPEISILPLDQREAGREIRVSLRNDSPGALTANLTLAVPSGWKATPASVPVEFQREGQTLTKKFRVVPPKSIAEGSVTLSASAEWNGRRFDRGYQVIDYDHTRLRHLFHPAKAQVTTLDVRVPANLRLGYIVGVGDYVPEALTQLGLDFDLLDEEDIAFSDLSRYDTIVTGVRAYLVREDLRSNNDRLLEWVRAGGNLVVQYNKFEFNEGRGDSPYAPFAARVGRGRVTDENAPVNVLVPGNPVFNSPNKIRASDWAGWVQERGLYFLGQRSDEYVDLVATEDPFEYNAGEKRGALVQAKYGKGTWTYVGLGLWRQLPAGVNGAYRLLANLLAPAGR